MNRNEAAKRRLARKGLREARDATAPPASAESLVALVGDPSQLSILDVMDHPRIFGPQFAGPTWTAWRVFLAVLFALPLSADQAAAFTTFTGRALPPAALTREAFAIVGRRGGKSRMAALLAVFLACFRDYRGLLAPGERGTAMVLAADRRQARTVFRYIVGLLDSVPALAAMIETRRADSIDLVNAVSIEVHTASYRSVRGYTLIACLGDEIAFWDTGDSANPDSEILAALRPALATIPWSVLLAISTPYAKRGELWKAYERHWAKDDSAVLVWQADTCAMNPTIDAGLVERATEDDAAAAAAEYGAQFRSDVEAFLPPDAIAAVTVRGRFELPRQEGVRYLGFIDPSGGSQDSMTLGIAHAENGRGILDVLRERRPPFSPDGVARDFADVLKSYGIAEVRGDRYGGEWPRERFLKHGIMYRPVEQTKSELYLALLPLVMGGRCEILDEKRCLVQLGRLERRTARSGKDSIDHPPGAHDDVANAAAGALVLAAGAPRPLNLADLRRLVERGARSGTGAYAQHPDPLFGRAG